jgi:protein TorT
MKKYWSCVSNRRERIENTYPRIIGAAILALCGFFGGIARADQQLLCVLVPHFKDEYWLSVAYGVEQRSAEQGLSVQFFEAGGYNALENQIAQLETCSRLAPRAILIGAVSSDAPGLLAAVERAAERRPVIGLVNELHSDVLVARVGVDWTEMGRLLGRHLAARFQGRTMVAVLLSGPTQAGWVAPLERGLREGLAGSPVRIVATYAADTGTEEQLRILETARRDHPEAGLVIGTAPAIEAAMALDAPGDGPALAATYVSHSVARGLAGNRVLAAPFDNPMEQGRLAVDAALAAGRRTDVDPMIGTGITILQQGISGRGLSLSPADYFPRLD